MKAYDFSELGKKIAEKAKADGLELAEEAVEQLGKAAYAGLKEWATESAALSDTKIDDFIAPFYSQLDAFVNESIAKIDLNSDGKQLKNSFVVNYAVHMWIASMSISGPLGAFVAFFAKRILGDMIDRGLIVVDIQIDKLKQALKDKQWKEAALKAYNHASARVYSEAEKDAIRKEYLDALSKYATYGDGLPDD